MNANSPRNGAVDRLEQGDAETIRIEDGVPIPKPPLPYTTKRATYPFATMQVGQSFETSKPSVASAAKKYMDRMAARGEVVVLLVRKQKNGKYRCWRCNESEAREPRLRPRKTHHERKAPLKVAARQLAVAAA